MRKLFYTLVLVVCGILTINSQILERIPYKLYQADQAAIDKATEAIRQKRNFKLRNLTLNKDAE